MNIRRNRYFLASLIFASCALDPAAAPESSETSDNSLVTDIAYVDQTPICHYLERGIDDFQPGQRNTYVVYPEGVETLSDIDHLTFGLDKPQSKCSDQPHTVPCTDTDVSKEMCIEKIEMYVGTKKLYEEANPGGCVETLQGGKSGMRTIDRAELRSNALWRWTIDELLSLLEMVDSQNDELAPQRIAFGADYLSLTLEGILGDFFARTSKGCANALYCDQKRGWLGAKGANGGGPLFYFARAANVDCDLGGCSSTTSRKSSPWVETRGVDGKELKVDIDVELMNSTFDPKDCYGDQQCGNLYTPTGRGSVETRLQFPCIEHAYVAVATGGDSKQFKMPYCDQASPASPCFKKGLGAQPGTVHCDTQSDSSVCGESATLVKTRFDQNIAVVGSPTFDVEGGLIPGLIDFLCAPIGLSGVCDLLEDYIATQKLVKQLDAALLNRALFKDLKGCPAYSVSEAGQVAFDFRNLDSCPPGAHDPACGAGGAYKVGGSGQDHLDPKPPTGGFSTVTADPPTSNKWSVAAPSITALVGSGGSEWIVGSEADVAASVTALPKSFAQDSGTPSATATLALKAQPSGAAAPLNVQQINGVLANMCAVNRHCESGFNLAPTLKKLTPVQLQKLAENGLSAIDVGVVQTLSSDPAFMKRCVDFSHPYDVHDSVAARVSLQAWTSDVLLEANQTGTGSCKKQTKGIESLMPVPGIYLAITTAKSNVTDQFAFVNVRKDEKPSDISADTRKRFGCKHIQRTYLPAANPPTCVAGRDKDGNVCGTAANGPCADIREFSYQSISPPDLMTSRAHPNGDFSPFHYCASDANSGAPMVCVGEQFNGAGGGTFGVCKVCGGAGGNEPGTYTMQGCPAKNAGDDACPDGYERGADGRCWDVHRARPDWECDADCKALYGNYGYCFHKGAWRNWWEDHSPEVSQAIEAAQHAGKYYSNSICAEAVSCPLDGASCAAKGQACSNDTCTAECTTDANCDPLGGFPLRYPDGFVCSAQKTCRL